MIPSDKGLSAFYFLSCCIYDRLEIWYQLALFYSLIYLMDKGLLCHEIIIHRLVKDRTVTLLLTADAFLSQMGIVYKRRYLAIAISDMTDSKSYMKSILHRAVGHPSCRDMRDAFRSKIPVLYKYHEMICLKTSYYSRMQLILQGMLLVEYYHIAVLPAEESIQCLEIVDVGIDDRI